MKIADHILKSPEVEELLSFLCIIIQYIKDCTVIADNFDNKEIESLPQTRSFLNPIYTLQPDVNF